MIPVNPGLIALPADCAKVSSPLGRLPIRKNYNDEELESMFISPLNSERVAKTKIAFTLRRVNLSAGSQLISGRATPKAGDIVLARVEQLNQHKSLQLTDGRRSRLFLGDEILVCFGNRYAPDQYEAYVPESLGRCHLVAGGGIAASVSTKSGMVGTATAINVLGILADGHGSALNIADFALPQLPHRISPQPVIAVAGTSMNAGKTETVISLVKGLVRNGFKVGTAKVTGTGAGGDMWAAVDSGATRALDFTDAGMPSTYHTPIAQVEQGALNLIAHLNESNVDVIVLELADGLFQTETAALLTSPAFMEQVDGIIFAAGDAMGAVAGVHWLERHGLPVIGVSGLLTRSPLAIREAEAALKQTIYDIATLSSAKGAFDLVAPYMSAEMTSMAC